MGDGSAEATDAYMTEFMNLISEVEAANPGLEGAAQAGADAVVAVMGDGGANASSSFSGEFSNIQGEITSYNGAFTGAATSIGSNISAGVAVGVRSNAGVVYAAVGGIVRGALAHGQRVSQSRSPSKLFDEKLGAYMGQGIGVGTLRELERLKPKLKKSMIDLTRLGKIDASVEMVNSVNARTQQTIQLKAELTAAINLDRRKIGNAVFRDIDDRVSTAFGIS